MVMARSAVALRSWHRGRGVAVVALRAQPRLWPSRITFMLASNNGTDATYPGATPRPHPGTLRPRKQAGGRDGYPLRRRTRRARNENAARSWQRSRHRGRERNRPHLRRWWRSVQGGDSPKSTYGDTPVKLTGYVGILCYAAGHGRGSVGRQRAAAARHAIP